MTSFPSIGGEWAVSLAVTGFLLAVLPALPSKRTWARTLAVALGMIVAVRYMRWRLVATVLPESPLTAAGAWIWFLFQCEIAATANFGLTFAMLSSTSDRTGEANRREHDLRRLPDGDHPRVDVFLCTYNEDLEVLRRPIRACRNLDYPSFTVWVLDDGRRPWLRDYCAAQGVNYLTRPDNLHAKAGNINHALSRTDGEFFAVLDADFVPEPNFLMRTVGFFADPTIAIVQTPHHFFNSDPYLANLRLDDMPNEQHLFFDVLQPSRDAWGCAFCCGSASVQRRSAIMGVGGVPTASVTEDILSTLVLMRQGFVTRFLNEPLAFGLAPESVSAMFVQRQRWCRGGLQMLFLKEGVFGPGLTLLQRLLFFPLDWLVQTPARLLSVLVPIIFLWTGLAPIRNAHLSDLINYQLPVIIALLGLIGWLSDGRHVPFVTAGQSLLLSFRIVPTIAATLIKPFGVPFRVTPKGSGAARGVDRFARTSAQALIALNVLGLLINTRPETRLIANPDHLIAAFFFSVPNILLLFLVVLASRDGRCESAPAPSSEAVDCETEDGKSFVVVMSGVSAGGAFIRWPRGQAVPPSLKIRLPEDVAFRAVAVGVRGDDLELRFDLAEKGVRERVLPWVYTMGPGTIQTRPSMRRLAKGIALRGFD
ncbi:glycosyltransferase family 2 protein [Paludisphaera soli]|uniref:glycosyltransferase family 2 protein n=1 Tax=Paludisphaera soli TaxID=2712865 RepID=UPI0013EC567C|nr:cellulose synthase catalytic subunit [Paludisphaera soli]